MTTFYATDGMVGADLNNTYVDQKFPLLTTVSGNNNSKWVYVYASGAVAAGDCVAISATGTAATATGATAATPTNTLAFAQNAFAAADYGWVANGGDGLTISVSATAASLTQLYIATTAGKLSATAASGSLAGIQITNASATATTTTTTGTVTWPRCITPGF